ncbi:hypothetical protein SISSUDRAFT_530616 [Sistotremastrum suecicum HHB10207 ss-3]|uniref:Uncharacterized protein n=1 Tax=Sistotremastrum suecicum HHB10207 ss-3 TaxID=1314776 RepID=A0A166F3H7_9AGAM|nr:hypothetical protein SISSUDRAFT_530616 [Sistotremastrum suecicum HHB10207 ss-3]
MVTYRAALCSSSSPMSFLASGSETHPAHLRNNPSSQLPGLDAVAINEPSPVSDAELSRVSAYGVWPLTTSAPRTSYEPDSYEEFPTSGGPHPYLQGSNAGLSWDEHQVTIPDRTWHRFKVDTGDSHSGRSVSRAHENSPPFESVFGSRVSHKSGKEFRNDQARYSVPLIVFRKGRPKIARKAESWMYELESDPQCQYWTKKNFVCSYCWKSFAFGDGNDASKIELYMEHKSSCRTPLHGSSANISKEDHNQVIQ